MKIYLIKQENTSFYKIGCTKRKINERIKELQTGNGSNLILIHEFKTKYGFKLENLLHFHFKQKKVNLEWFELTKEDVDNFLTICNKYENNFISLNDNHFFK